MSKFKVVTCTFCGVNYSATQSQVLQASGLAPKHGAGCPNEGCYLCTCGAWDNEAHKPGCEKAKVPEVGALFIHPTSGVCYEFRGPSPKYPDRFHLVPLTRNAPDIHVQLLSLLQSYKRFQEKPAVGSLWTRKNKQDTRVWTMTDKEEGPKDDKKWVLESTKAHKLKIPAKNFFDAMTRALSDADKAYWKAEAELELD